jgi:hypothetical protein
MDICEMLESCEKARLPDQDLENEIQDFKEQIKIIVRTQKKVNLMNEKGIRTGALNYIDKELDDLGSAISDFSKDFMKLVKKYAKYYETIKELIDPIFRIMDNILKQSQGTALEEDIIDSFIV